MAARCGLSQNTVTRIWRGFGRQPHRSAYFKLSKDPLFIENVRDIVGPYLDPPERALRPRTSIIAEFASRPQANPSAPVADDRDECYRIAPGIPPSTTTV